ncbi:serine/threonine-protein kinase STY13-like [Apium graveolens]|uniref:serine/threonine-protein kinase STY13-like n=1 Tax=Apium graveolens TaxID=4045 RepID=UPI003D7B120F
MPVPSHLYHFLSFQQQIHPPSSTMQDPLAPGGELYWLVQSRYQMNCGINIEETLRIDLEHLKFEAMIGKCGYSVVFKGTYKSTPVAIKIVLPDLESELNSTWQERFGREVALHSRSRHENIVKFIGASLVPALMIITEFMGGGTLQKYLADIHPNCLDLELSVHYALEISRAMTYLHAQGIIHRDLKPNNMLLSEDKKTVKITDFGLSREEIVGDMSTEAGTYRWMAPEMFEVAGERNQKRYDHKVDVYSFSLVLWELLTNKIPFKGRCCMTAAYAAVTQNARPSTDNIPKEIVPLLVSCWAADPADRPEFIEIKCFLENFIHYLWTPDTSPLRMITIGHANEPSAVGECEFTSHGMQNPNGVGAKARSAAGRFIRCFGSCA